jgi:hypothetical protein
MTDESTREDAVTVDRTPPDEVFGLLANDVRVDILRALAETPDDAVAFSDLYDRVAVADSGNFNYHLEQLRGSFVREADGYELTLAGEQMVGALLAGTYTADAAVDQFELDWDCLLCGGRMTAAYREERAWITCGDCGKGARFPFPPGSLEQFDRAELPAAFARWLRTFVQRATTGFCYVCAGRVDGELARLPGGTEDDPKPSRVTFECRRCDRVTQFSGSTLATYYPEVEAFFFEHNLELLEGHASRAWSRLDEFDSRILSEHPPRLEVRFAYGGERVTAEITPDAEIETVRRRQTDGETGTERSETGTER